MAQLISGPDSKTRSGSLDALAGALSKAQAKIRTASKDASNPHFQSRYADLASVWEACREALTSEGLSVVQMPCGDGDRVGLTTTLLHSSGQWMASTIFAGTERKGPQAVGSVLTYLRRYSLAACVGVSPGDETEDDGNAATNHDRAPAPSNDNGRRIAHAPRAPQGASEKLAQRNAEPSPAPGVPSQPSSSEPATRAQMRHYHKLREALNVTEDEGRERVSKVIGREIASMTDVTVDEMSRVITKMTEASGNGAA